MEYQIDSNDSRLLIIRFKSKNLMNKTLGKISLRYEGIGTNCEAHNFPAEFVEKSDLIYNFVNKNNIQYIIGIYNNKSIKHEKLHAKYFLDPIYKKKINDEFELIDNIKKQHIIFFLKKLGYCDKVIIDEYQAYKYSEKPNFFGIKL